MKLTVNLEKESYDIYLERGILSRAEELIKPERRVLVVTDDGVPKEYAMAVAGAAKQATLVTLPMGEESKSLSSLSLLWKTMLEASFSRGDCVVAVGGGVVGDLCGFAAATYMRGIDFYNIPTTWLSQVDSSIGGKTAIDFGGVKNIVGSFYQPKAVLIDPETLKTLDERQLRAGLVESVKMAVCFDEPLFERIEKSRDIIGDAEEIIRRSLDIKRDVVEKDPTEKGLRRVLNFGHTLGHAIEGAAKGALLHGECVALGMLPMCAPALRERVRRLWERLGLPTTVAYTADELLPYLIHDKKAVDAGIAAVYADTLGSYRIERVSPEALLAAMEETI